MAMCQDSLMTWADDVVVGVKHRAIPSSLGQDRVVVNNLQALGTHDKRASILENNFDVRDAILGAVEPKSPSIYLSNIDYSTGRQQKTIPFAPDIDVRAVQLSEKISTRSPDPYPILSWSGFGSSNDLPAAKTSPSASDWLLPFRNDVSVEAERQRLEAEVKEFLASLDRELLGREPRPQRRDLEVSESGEIVDDQEYDHIAAKRKHVQDSKRPVKRARRNPRQEFSMMPSRSCSGKRYYSGLYLNSTPLHQQTSYVPVKRLGTGGQGTAHLLKTPRRGSLVVCKVIPHQRHHIYVESELAALRDALPPHNRIVKIRSALISPSQTQLYLDYYNGGDLSSFMEKYHYGLRTHCIPESFIWHTLLQLSEALAYIHHGYDRTATPATGRQKLPKNWLTVIHRDIKPANILLQRAPHSPIDHPGPEPYPRLVLADFGLAVQATTFDEPPTSDIPVGTFAWQPPESPHHSTKGDVWALGAVIFQMCTGRLPFDEEMPQWVQDIHGFRIWCDLLSKEERRRMFGIRNERYGRGLERCLVGALEMEKDERWGALELLRRVEESEGRGEARWVELVPWVWGE
ncbi:MAG: hypothetical protein L6R41_005317 [Letrouitia leprolyta]|nr:MAG: hypothetical protein L6R41_005317 [Letrouitia leprolyta]